MLSIKRNTQGNVNSTEKNQRKVEVRAFQLSKLLHNITMNINTVLEENNNVIFYDIKSYLGRYLIGDNTQIEEVLRTLLLRSSMLSKNSEIVLSITEDKHKCLIFSINNKEGKIGSKEDKHYMQNHKLTFNESQIIADSMGGEIKLKNSWLSGAEFTFRTPYHKDVKSRSCKESIRAVLLGKKALFISDSKNDINNIGYMFETFGMNFKAMPLSQFEERKPDLSYYDVVLVKSKYLNAKHISFFKTLYKNDQMQLKIILMHEFTEQFKQNSWMKHIAHAELFGPAIIGDIEEILYNLFVMKSNIDDTINNIEDFSMKNFEIVEDNMLEKEYFSMYGSQHLAIVITDQNARRNIERMLTMDGFFLHFVTNGKEMIDLLRREKIDLIFTEIELGIMNGYKMTEQIRQNQYWKKIPVVAISLDLDNSSMKKMSLSGMNAVIPKYHTKKHIYAALKKYLHSSEPEIVQKKKQKVKDFRVKEQILDVRAGVKYAGSTLAYKKSLTRIVEKMDSSFEMMKSLIESKNITKLQQFVDASLSVYSEVFATGTCHMFRELNQVLRIKNVSNIDGYISLYWKHLKKLEIEINDYIAYIDSHSYKILA